MVPQIPTDKWWLRGVFARSVGIVAVALGFVIGMYGLDHPASHWLQTALGVARDRDGGPRLWAVLLDQTHTQLNSDDVPTLADRAG